MIERKVMERYLKIKTRSSDESSSDNERAIAARICEKIEAEYPGIAETAAAYQAAQKEPDATLRAQSYEDTWRDKLREWLTETVEQVTRGLSIVEVVDEDVDVEITSNTRTVHIKIKIPVDSALDVAEETGGSLQEYARLVGLRVGRELAGAFEDSGY
jgi:hypothetical protein|tara:strand:+ start:73 stop:546 length:474 start_codon:yes stop_codon:yes gene_type:complete